jgi:hypothetical protein
MSIVTDRKKCKECEQCGYEFGVFESNCRTSEWKFMCGLCGYSKSLRMIKDGDGNHVGWRHDTLNGYGACLATLPGNGKSELVGLRTAQDVDESACKMRDLIAKGELDGERSYVTRWDALADSVEVIAGRWTEDDWGEKDTRDPKWPDDEREVL